MDGGHDALPRRRCTLWRADYAFVASAAPSWITGDISGTFKPIIPQANLPNFRSHLTLALSTVLHAFTHAYGSMLVPLYVMMRDDLHLNGLRKASLVVTVYGAVYSLGSYFAGLLSDRFNRKTLLGIGLLGNALAILMIGLTGNYGLILAMAVAAGLFGTLYHPAANALGPAHYPASPGMAIGLLGIGSGLGFFIGPRYAGWRALHAGWHAPCIDMSIAGLVFGLIFLLVAYDPRPPSHHRTVKLPPRFHRQISLIASILMFRDFAGVGMMSLAALYFQKVFGQDSRTAGLNIGLMMLPSIVFSPLSIACTNGRSRLIALPIILCLAALIGLSTPFFGSGMALVVLCIFQTLQLISYSLGDAAILERVDPDVRGRVVGLFLLIAGTFGALSPWVMGGWVDQMGSRENIASAYFGPLALLSGFMAIASFAPLAIAGLGPPRIGSKISPLEEISPQMVEPVM